MSFLKLIKAQLGLSNTPANNFHFDASADNGTGKLARGNIGAPSQDIITWDAAGKVAFPQNAQTWQTFAVPSVRALATGYPNSTGQPIKLAFRGQNAVAAGYMTLEVVVATVSVSKQTVATTVANQEVIAYVDIPVGSTYSVNFTGNNTPTVIQWAELR